MKLKLWVKVVLALIVTIIAIIMLNNQGKKAVEQCVSNGHSEQYCINHLG